MARAHRRRRGPILLRRGAAPGRRREGGSLGLHPALRGRLLTSDVSRDGVQSGIATGRAGLSTALPLETVTWLAILDLYRNRGKETQDAVYKRGLGKYQSSIKSQSKDLDSGDESRTLAATKELSAFLVNPLIDCSAQVKIFGEQVVGSTAAQQSRDLARQDGAGEVPEWKLREQLGLEARGRGQVSARLVSRVHDNAPQYELKIHMAIEVDNDAGISEMRERAMQCRSKRPIFARDLAGYWIEAREHDGYWTVSAQASEAAGTVSETTKGVTTK